MHVDFSGWDTRRPGLVWGHYFYSHMGGTRDTELEVHWDIQAGVGAYFVSFLINNLDFPREARVRVSLRPMDGGGPQAVLRMMGRPDNGGAVFGLASREDTNQCLSVFFAGKEMHFEVDSESGERLIRLPLPNIKVFETVFRETYARVQDQGDSPLAELLAAFEKSPGEHGSGLHQQRQIDPNTQRILERIRLITVLAIVVAGVLLYVLHK